MRHGREDIGTAIEAAIQAGAIAKRTFGRKLKVEFKQDASPVTRIDRECEEHLRQVISKAYPSDDFLGEEFGGEPARGRPRWILDPLDGTKNFIRGIPFWGVLVAREVENRLTLGVIYLPILNELYWARRGEGAFFNRKRIHVSRIGQLRRSYLLHGGLECFARCGHEKQLSAIAAKSAISRSFGDCWAYTWVARGCAEAMVEVGLKPWDTAPCRIIVEEAGGRFTDWNGNPTHHSPDVIASNGNIHCRLVKMLSGRNR